MHYRISQIGNKLEQDRIKQKKRIRTSLDQTTRKLIQDNSPMWTNKQIWEFEQLNEELTFDTAMQSEIILSHGIQRWQILMSLFEMS